MGPSISLTRKTSKEEVLQQFDQWRGTRKRTTPIPERLWEGAVNLCADESVYRISKFLHLDYNALKKRIGRSQPSRAVASRKPSDFVELDWKSALPECEYLLEKEDKDGGKRKMQIKGRLGLDVLEVMKFFWGTEP